MSNFEEYKKLLNKFVSFKSISTDPKYIGEIDKTVSWLCELFTKNGFKTQIFKGKNCNPVVFSSFTVSPKLQTLLIYGHYDVQPAEKSDGWKADPYTLTQSGKKLVARGVVDNKGQIMAHIVTALSLIKSKEIGYNIKFLIEGNEETGNGDLAGIMVKNKKLLSCDTLMVSDGELTNNKPTIEVSLRGGFNCTLTYITGKNNLHSGLAGGAVPNSAIELSKFLSKLFNNDGTVSFASFYKGLDKISADQVKNNNMLQKEAKNIPSLMGVKSLLMPKGGNFFTQTGLMPTIQISGLKSGYIETGYANIVPAVSEVRLNFRLAASQKSKEIVKEFKKFVTKNTPIYVSFDLEFEGLHDPVKINLNNNYLKVSENILKDVYKTNVQRRNVGGAIPFVGDVKNILGVDTLLIPMANEDCNMHGTNENFDIDLIKKALTFSNKFMCHTGKFYRPIWDAKPGVVRKKR